MIDEATYRTLEYFLIFCIVNLSNNEREPHVTRFIELLALRDGTTKSLYEVITRLLEKMHWMSLNQVALATDGVASMTGPCTGLAARMRIEIPTLINVHCIVHHKALVIGDAARAFLENQMLDCFCQKQL